MTERAASILCRLAGAAVCALLAACAVTRPATPPLVSKAERLNSRAVAAAEQGRFREAEAGFAEAYTLYGTVEDHAGMVTALVNSSRLYRSRGMTGRASAMAERAGEMVHHVPRLAAEVCFERAKICLLQGDTACATEWSEQALQASGEESRAMITGLRADIHLKRGEWQQCTELAREALALAGSAGDRHESADAHRIMGDCQLAGRQPRDACRSYGEALRLDKELAQPREVYADLKGLSACHAQQGDRGTAADYLLRAADIAIASGDTEVAAADLEGALTLDGTRGAVIAERLRQLQERGAGGTAQ